MNWRSKWFSHIGSAVLASAIGLSLTMMFCQSISIGASVTAVIASCLFVGLICSIGASSKKGTVVAAAACVIFAAYLCFSSIRLPGSIMGLFSQLAALYSGQEADINLYATTIAVLVSCITTGFLFWMIDMEGGVYPAIALCVVVMMCVWLLGRSVNSVYAFIAVAALACMFVRAADDSTSYFRAAPSAIIAAVVAIALLPAGNPTWQPLEQAAQKVRDMFNDYFFFTDPRTTYSISSDGFQPMGESLGGPAQPSPENVMIVETNDVLFLRGSVKRTYTTYSWTESAINSRYVFIDPMRKGIRDEVFDVDKLEGLNISGAFKRISSLVTVVNEGISTLFVPHRLVNLSMPLDLAAYFSTSGEVFITRGVLPSDTYTIDAYIQTDDANALKRVISSANDLRDAEYDAAKNDYTSLPSGIDSKVYSLAQSITQNASTAYDKAVALERHLLNNYKYSLSVKYPPRNKDFVSNFLLNTKKGYCSYFASAMAVMARMVGLPSRYVEGYMVPVRSGQTTLVTGKNAHAWVEIYFNGIGWITFNPTPGSGDDYTLGDGESGEGQDESEQDEQETEPEQTDAQPTPGVPDEETAPEESGEDDGQTGEEEQPSETDEPQSGEETPPEEDETPDENGGETDENPPLNLWWLLALPIIAGLAFIAKRLSDSDPKVITRGLKVTDDKLSTWYRAILLALEYQGQTPDPSETPGQFAQRMTKQKLADAAIIAVANQISINRYAGKRPDATVLKQARQAYSSLVRQLNPLERARWYAHRITKGIGDIKNIP